MSDQVLLPVAAAPPKGDVRPATPSASDERQTSFKKALDAAGAANQPKPKAEAKPQSPADGAPKAEADHPAEAPSEAAPEANLEAKALENAVPAEDPATLAAMALLLAQLQAAQTAVETVPAQTTAASGEAAEAIPAALTQAATTQVNDAAAAQAAPALPAELTALLKQATAHADTASLSADALNSQTAAETEGASTAGAGKSAKPAAAPAVKPAETVFQNVLGNLTAAPAAPKLEMARLAEAQALPALVSPETVLPQIVRGVEGLARSGATSMHLQLYPESLGRIDVQLTAGADGMRVTLTADRLTTGNLLQQNLSDLRHTLVETGLNISGLSVGVGQQNTGQPFGWQQAPHPAGRPAGSFTGDDEAEASAPAASLTAAGAGTRINYWI